eukprot:Lankesteria_metandrocarpae@DN4600_c0_g1_i4.p1
MFHRVHCISIGLYPPSGFEIQCRRPVGSGILPLHHPLNIPVSSSAGDTVLSGSRSRFSRKATKSFATMPSGPGATCFLRYCVNTHWTSSVVICKSHPTLIVADASTASQRSANSTNSLRVKATYDDFSGLRAASQPIFKV